MFMLTKHEDDIESGAYATLDDEGIAIIQFFVDKDDAVTYNTHLSAIGFELSITETPDENIDKICDILGYPYTVAQPGEVVVPRTETLLSQFTSD